LTRIVSGRKGPLAHRRSRAGVKAGVEKKICVRVNEGEKSIKHLFVSVIYMLKRCMAKRTLSRSLLFALLLSGCTLHLQGCTPAPDTRSAEEAAIRELDAQFSAAAARNDLDATVSYYSEDAVLLAPNTPIANNPKAIRESWASILSPNTSVSWEVTKVEVAKSGELGYLYGTYQLSIKDPSGGPTINDTGKILEVWKKQPDGQWKCIVDAYNSDIPLPAPSEPKK